MSDLKPCPFCGSKAELIDNEHMGHFSVVCKSCFCEIQGHQIHPKLDEIGTIRLWNTRADEWQPIETAPKDGTEILGLDQDAGEARVVFWDKRVKLDQHIGLLNVNRGACWVKSENYETFMPNTWQPLPAPPKGDE